MTKIVYNNCHGGFAISREAVWLARQISGDENWGGCTFKGECWPNTSVIRTDDYEMWYPEVPRHDPVLVEVVETLGSKKASGKYATLEIENVPSGTLYRIDEYDGKESVMSHDDYAWSVAP